MKRLFLLQALFTCLAVSPTCHGQDFSNKGKDFWIIYTGHVDGTTSRMALYLTSDQNATGTVNVAGSIINFTVTANQVTTIRITNTSVPSNSLVYNGQTVGIGTNRGIHVVSDHPIVVYSHILNAARSGSTLVLPTNVLGREYYVSTYASILGGGGAVRRAEFAVCATQDNTTIEITPTATDATSVHPANTPFQVTLNTGDVFQYQSADQGDLTGTYIKSIATATSPCKPIAVFAGSTWTAMGCASAGSGDNLYQQLFPFVSWGKEYITAPFILRSYDVFRILVKDPTTVVQVNGVALSPATLINNTYYDFNTSGNNTPRIITSDKPICVIQYMITQSCDGVNSDPEMIILNSVEQTLSDITVLSARSDLTPPATNITRHFLNIIVKTAALGSLRVDGAACQSVPVTIPATGYSYLQEEVTSSTNTNPSHRITCDSGFLAIAYGYGNVESYGYNAGTNIRDLYQFVSVHNQFATVNFPAACKNSPFTFSMTFPYQPTQIVWDFGGLFPNVTVNSPVYDSTFLVNGKQLFLYRLNNPYTITNIGTYPIKVLAQNPTPDGCSGQQEINYDLQVFDPPVADFNIINNGCLTDTVFFNDVSNLNGRTAIRWHWDFGDTGVDSTRNTKHKYGAPGSFTVKYSLITDIGCLSDTASKVVSLTPVPLAKFGASLPYCIGRAINFSDSSQAFNGSTIVKWYWNFGDGSPQIIATSNAIQSHAYSNTGTYNATLKVETTTGCQSLLYSFPITIHPNPVASFNLPNVCLPAGTANFSSTSTISDGSQGLLTYLWNFGDGGTAITQNPVHNFNNAGPFNVSLTVTSNNGCIDDSIRSINTIYAEPLAAFSLPAEVCLGTPVNPIDQSTAPGSTVTQWNWDFGDGTISTLQNPVKNYANPGTYTITLSVTSAIGCRTINNTATRSIVVNPLPTANFNTSVPSCATRFITFTDASSANAGNLVTWTWNYGDGSNAVLNNPAAFTHVYTSAGTYNATLVVETNKGCISTLLSKPITIYPIPEAGYISPEVCLTDPIAPFTDTSHVAGGNIIAWDWNFGDPNASGPNPNASTLQNPGHRYSVVGAYTARLIITTDQGCKDTISQTFTVNGSIPIAGIVVQHPSVLCSNRDVSITDASTVDFGSMVKVEIYWDYTNDPTNKTIDDIPVAGGTYTHLYPEFGTPVSKTYTIRYVAYSGINCLNVLTRTITVLATPSLQFNAVEPVCSNDPAFNITEAQLLNGLPGSYTYTGTGVNSGGQFNPAVAGAGVHTIRYTFNAANGCTNFKEQTIEVYPTPIANAGPDKVVLEGGFVTLSPALTAGMPVTYLWTPSSGLNDVTLPAVIASPADDITYTLTVTSDQGCHTNDQVFVKVLKAPVIPNIFSPNNDGTHDTWEIQYLESYPGATVDIYNRYGQLIFHSSGYTHAWDGTINGKPVPIGTYYYIVDPKNGRKKVSGYVDVIR
ncbi:MAG TPA: PKD domain-containing protein [Chitinophagaceae bacterium]|nr:PKD domain-containing protein [Chitinophagaceae bacterium]